MRWLPLLFGLCMLCACTTGKNPSNSTSYSTLDNRDWDEHAIKISKIERWRAEGRLSASTPEDTIAWHFIWDQNVDRYHIHLNHSWVGGGRWQIEGTTAYVQLHQPSAPAIRANTPEALVAELFGWQAPISHIKYWMVGIPNPELPYTGTTDATGALRSLLQDGWRIEYETYHPITSLPQRIRITSEGKHPLQLKIVVQKWT